MLTNFCDIYNKQHIFHLLIHCSRIIRVKTASVRAFQRLNQISHRFYNLKSWDNLTDLVS